MRSLCLRTSVFLCVSVFTSVPLNAIGADPTTKPADASKPLRLGNAGLRLGRPWAFTPDGTKIFTERDNAIDLWDTASGKPIRSFSDANGVMECTMSADGTTVAGWAGNHVAVWNIATGKKVASLATTNGFAINPVLSNDGKTIAWINPNYKGIIIRDVPSGKEIAALAIDEKDGQPTNILLSPDGKTLADGGGGVVVANNIPKGFSTVRIWDVAAKRVKIQARYEEGYISALAFTPDSKRLVTGGNILRLWDVTAAKEIAKLPPDGSMRAHITLAPDGKTLVCLSSAGNGAAGVDRFDITGNQFKPVNSMPLSRQVNVISSDGRYAAHGNAAANVMETQTGKPFGVDVGPTSNTKFAAFVSNGSRLLTVTEDGTAFLWEAGSGKLLKRYDMQTPRVVDASVSSDGGTVVLTDDMTINGFDMNAGNQLYSSRPAIGRRVSLAAISPDGKRVAATGRLFDMQMNSGLFVWNSQVGGAPKVERAIPTFHVSGICWSPDGSGIAVGCADETVRLFNSVSGVEQTTFRLPGSPPPAVAGGPNQMIRRNSEKSIASIDFSPDGRILAATLYNGDLAIWESPSGKFVRLYPKLEWTFSRVRFDPRGFAMATLTVGGKINFWEASTGVKIASLQTGRQIVAWNFSPDGQRLVVGGDPADNAIWKSPLSDPIHHIANLPGDSDQHLEKLWAGLADRDAGRAFQSARLLAAEGKPAIQFLAGHLQWPAPSPEARAKILALINNLSADEFKTRRSAERQLREMNGAARPLLIESLKNPASIDARLSMDRLLNEDPPATDISPDDARYLRAIAALEQLGGPEAITLLQSIWDTSTNLRAAAEARASLGRLRARSESK